MIAAIASRPYVQAAVVAGYEVIAIDCFADKDTKRVAKAVHQVSLQNGQLDAGRVLEVISGIDSKDVAGFCYGAGFEMQAAVLDDIAKLLRVFGNAADVVKQCKDPNLFFQYCDHLAVPYPSVLLQKPSLAEGWLQKKIGSSGGTHIKQVSAESEGDADIYFQKHQAGKSISCLFFASANNVQVIGFNEQWLDGNSVLEPFRYGGAASQAEVSELAKTRLTDYVSKLANAIGLIGLNSCDAICDGDEVFILEINPRLSASIDLYISAHPDLIAKHVKASGERLLEGGVSNGVDQTSTAHQVIYAKNDMTIARGFSWPVWVADIPEEGSDFKVGMPVCTVLGQESVAMQAKNLVQDRAVTLNKRFLN
ncbi:MAG: ATP-grasp domain-containing protein [Methylophilaceae bacterium]